jgi:alpha-galactosidase
MSSISFDQSRREWALADGDLLYMLGLDADDALCHRYVGLSPRRGPDRATGEWWEVPSEWTYPFDSWWEAPPRWEYPSRGPYVFGETTVASLFGPADRDLHLRYAAHEIVGDQLVVRLVDRYHPLAVDLHYELTPGSGVVRRWAEIRNDGEEPVILEQAGAFAIFQPSGSYVLHHLTGAGLNEMNPVTETLAPGRKVLESRRGLTGHAHQPWFALATEQRDWILFGALEWSGNWKLSFETDIAGALSIVGGMSDFDFQHVLQPGASFTTPEAVVGVVAGSVDDASRAMHRFIRGHVMPRRKSEDTLPVIFEGWCTTFGKDMNAERLIKEAELVADIGVELFIVTAGWYTPVEGTFGFVSREGDWRPWPEAFPNGLEEVAAVVRGQGMRFGLWWEPESVSADSELFRAHPDWVYQFQSRGPQPTRVGQYVLNLCRPDVYEYLRNDIFRLVKQYGLDYFRTDMNQSLRELGDPSGRSGSGRDLAWRHVRNYYRLLDEVRAAFPDLIIENCAGGGGRIDLGTLRRTDTSWISDNVNQLVRLGMFMGATSFLPPTVCENWMVYSLFHPPEEPPFGRPEWPRPDLDFQFRVCMMGHMGIGADLRHASDEWKDRARHHIARYKELRRTIQHGDLYRLTPVPPRDGSGEWAAVAMVAGDQGEAVAFCYRLASAEPSFILRWPGLDPERDYDVEIDAGGERQRLSGAELGDAGLEVVVPERHSSALLIARRMKRSASSAQVR